MTNKHIAKPFIEAVKELDTKDLYNDFYWKEVDARLLDFYSQPFEIEMLVNLLPETIFHDEHFRGTQVHKGLAWQEAEEKKLFIGWRIEKQMEREITVNYAESNSPITFTRTFTKNQHGNWILEGVFGKKLTLNQFIDRANVELYWEIPLKEMIYKAEPALK